MNSELKPLVVLMADDDEDDCLLIQEAFLENSLDNPLYFVKDGEELLDYLYRRGAYADPSKSPRPGLILLDLNMPRKTGKEALAEIKADPNLRRIPAIVLTTSRQQEDVLNAYALGVNSFIVKPVTFDALVEVIKSLSHYWFKIVQLPCEDPF